MDSFGYGLILTEQTEVSARLEPRLEEVDLSGNLISVSTLSELQLEIASRDHGFLIVDLDSSIFKKFFSQILALCDRLPVVGICSSDDIELESEVIQAGFWAFCGGERIQVLGRILRQQMLRADSMRKLSAVAMTSQQNLETRMLARGVIEIVFQISADGRFELYEVDSSAPVFVFPHILVGAAVRDILPPPFADLTLNNVENAIRKKEIQFYTYDGTTVGRNSGVFEIRMVPVGENSARGFMRDITNQVLLWEVWRQAENMMSHTQELSKMGWWKTDHRTGVDVWSEMVWKIFQLDRQTVLDPASTALEYLVHSDDRQRLLSVRSDFQANGGSYDISYRVELGGGKLIWIREAATCAKDENGTSDYSYGIFQDITDLKEVEQKLRSAKEKAEESDQLKSTFLGNMSHEIRTPLNGLLGFSKLLCRQPNLDEEMRNQYLDIIQSSSEQLLTLVSSIIDLSKIESNQFVFYKERVLLNKAFAEMFDLLEQARNRENKQEISLQLQIPPMEVWINTDPTHLRQVLRQLCYNALKFTDKGEINIGFEQVGDEVLFHVRDTGIGIPFDKQGVIFERFRQVDDSRTRTYGGTGLGLTISRYIVEEQGGRLWLDSVPDLGTVFFFSLPARNAEPQNLVPEEWSELQGEKVLVVDDIPEHIKYMDALLEPLALDLHFASGGLEAIAACRLHKDFRVVFMDLQMPDTSGVDALREIHKFQPDLPVIAITAFLDESRRQEYLDAGFADFVIKPVSRQAVADIIYNLRTNVS